MSFELTVVDHRDGTGATATIAEAPPSSTLGVWLRPVSGDLGSVDWTETVTGTGDGDYPLDVPNGYYWAYCRADGVDGSHISNLVYFRASDAADAVLYRCLLAVQARIAALDLTGFDPANLLVRKIASDRDTGSGATYAFPSIQISPGISEVMSITGGTNRRDEVVYPIVVTILAADNWSEASGWDQYLGWRQQIVRAFRNQPLVGVDEVYRCDVAPREIVEPRTLWERFLFSSSIVLNITAREPRGLST